MWSVRSNETSIIKYRHIAATDLVEKVMTSAIIKIVVEMTIKGSLCSIDNVNTVEISGKHIKNIFITNNIK